MFKINRRMPLWFLAAAIAFAVMVVQLRRSDADGPVGNEAIGASAQAAETPKGETVETKSTTPVTSYSLHEDESDVRIREALKKPVKFEFEEIPLKEAIEKIGKDYNIPIWIDEKALADAVIAMDTPITRRVQSVSLQSALRLTLRPLQLTYRIDQGVLQITTQSEADQKLVVRIYPVGDLLTVLGRPNERDDSYEDNLVDIITTTVTPPAWDEVGGPCSVEAYRDSLIISATEEVHEQIAGLLGGLRKLRASQQHQLGGRGVDIGNGKALDAAEKALAQPIDWDFTEMPLEDAVKYIARQTGLEIQLDDRALADAVIAADTPVTFRLSGVRLRNALRLMLHPLQLTYAIRDEVVLITTQAEADQSLRIRLYPVGDLVVCGPEKTLNASQRRCDFDALIDVVRSTVIPNSWDAVGGPGSIMPYEGGLALVISQTEEAHAQIAAVLSRLGDVPKSEQPSTATKLLLKVYAPPPGVPASAAAELIRELIEPATWTESAGGLIRALPNHLVVKQTKFAHRQIEELLQRFSFGPTANGVFGGAFQVADDPVKPRGAKAEEADPFAPAANPFAPDPFGPPAPAAQPRGGQPAAPRDLPARRPDVQTPRAADAAPRRADRGDRPRKSGFAVHRQSAKEQRIRQELDNATDLEFNEVPLKDGIEYIKDKHAIEIQLDNRLLSDAAVATDTPLTINVKGISLRSALRLMLAQLPNNPTFVVRDEVLLITTRQGAEQRKLTRVYNISELVEVPRATVDDPVGPPIPAPGGGGYGRAARGGFGAGGGYGAVAPAAISGLSELANLIQQAIEPGTWTQEHGCSVVPLPTRDASLLVVRQSSNVHDEIEELLKSIRDAQRE